MEQDNQTQQLTEEYKQITNFPNYYVSNFGNVKKITNGREKQVSTLQSSVKLIDQNKKTKSFSIRKLVAQHFLENFQPIFRVYNKDNNVLNNRVDNLYQIEIQDEIKKQNFQEKQFKGICYVKKVQLYKVQIYLNKKVICFGYRKNILDALKLYNEKIIELNLQDKFQLNDIEKLEQKFKSN
ncbi:hypothetical protein ABPG72_020110 [Tetrahymena utriculariae]